MDKFIKVFKSGEGIEARRYCSGRQVLDEGLIDGRYVTRYRNCTGQVVPEMHMGLAQTRNLVNNNILSPSFRIGINGRNLLDGWEYAGFDEKSCCDECNCKVYSFGLVNKDMGINLKVNTKLTGNDFIMRSLEITNLSDKPQAITALMPFGGCVWVHPGLNERGLNQKKEELVTDNNAFAVAYNHLNTWGKEGDFFFDKLDKGDFSIGYNTGKSGYRRPGIWLRNRLNGETLVVEHVYSGNWLFKARNNDLEYEWLTAEMGMYETEGEALRVLMPGESVTSPEVHIGLFHESDDSIVQATHAHVRENILPSLPEGVPVSEIEANHRGYLCDRETEEGILQDIDVAKSIEAEMYVIDAGWYGTKEQNQWGNCVGDWVPGKWLVNGFKPIPEYAHKKGMRFGLWVEIEAIGSMSKLREDHPEWVARRHGVPCANGRALDLSNPVVEKFCTDTICELIDEYKLDMYRLDHNHEVGYGATREIGGFIENTNWRYYDAFKRIFTAAQKKFPNVVFQNCAGGGSRLDWGTMSIFHNTELSDWMRQPRSVRIFSGITMSLPPEVILRTFGTEVPEMQMDGDLDAQFRICMICRPIYRGIAPSVEELTPYLKEKALRYNRMYKEFFRPLMKDCLVYHHTPFQSILKAHESTVLEYASKDKAQSLIAIFLTTPSDNETMKVIPRGVSREKHYNVTFDNSCETVCMSGNDLLNRGVTVPTLTSMTSEFIIIKER